MSRRIPREFVPCDVNMTSDPAVQRAGAMAELVYRRGLELVKRCRRDGQVFTGDLPVLAAGIPGQPARHADALARENLWEPIDGGWQITGWLKWNLSSAEIEEAVEQRRIGAIRTNHKRHQKQGISTVDTCPICTGEVSE